MKPNQELRNYIRKQGFFTWQIAKQLSCHENTIFRLLRKDLSEEEKKMIYGAIDELKKQRETLESHSVISG